MQGDIGVQSPDEDVLASVPSTRPRSGGRSPRLEHDTGKPRVSEHHFGDALDGTLRQPRGDREQFNSRVGFVLGPSTGVLMLRERPSDQP